MTVEKVEIVTPPAYPDQMSVGEKKRVNVHRYAIGAIAGVIVLCLLIGGILGGIYLQNKSTKDLIKEFTLNGKDKNGNSIQEKVKIDTKNNAEEITAQNGKLHILEDYNRGIIVLRTTLNKLACYLKPLNKTGVVEPKALRDYMASAQLREEKEDFEYDENIAYTPASEAVSDRTFLSARAQQMCQDLDVFWMFPTQQKAREKRGICRRVVCSFRLVYVWRRGWQRQFRCGLVIYYC